jgi:hypothetical protein
MYVPVSIRKFPELFDIDGLVHYEFVPYFYVQVFAEEAPRQVTGQ